ncbi:Uncharacterized protein TCM_019591 [Theobroma cacao]|uniref:Uncharacterized protein n=1 Tax=Theobroma cacao TaxID=3641 RepID=A0A061EIR6_THECC|nr:Uncharacterized protein TCM_019591 [Theobroma cacao]
MKASLFICFLLSSVLVLPFAFSARELHIVEHIGARNTFPVNPSTGKTHHTSCYRERKYYVCNVPTPPSRGTLAAPVGCRTCPTPIYVPRNSPCPCTIK